MTIVITGPRSVGKTTVSKRLATLLRLPYRSSDELLDARLASHGGLVATMKEGRRALLAREGIAMVEQAMTNDAPFVFDLAGGAIGDRNTRGAVLSCLQDAWIVGLIPGEDATESIGFLLAREQHRSHFTGTPLAQLRAKVELDYLQLWEPLTNVAQQLLQVRGRTLPSLVEEIALAWRDA